MPSNPMEVGTLLIQLAAAAALYLKIQSAVRQMAGKGQQQEITNDPLHTQKVPRPATLEDVQREAKRITRLENRLESYMQHAATERHELTESVDSMRDRIDDKFSTVNEKLGEISRAVGRLEGS